MVSSGGHRPAGVSRTALPVAIKPFAGTARCRHRYGMRILLALFLLPLTLLGQGGLPSQPYIYVEGKAEVEKAADLAKLRFEIFARAPEQAAANKEVQATATSILALLNQRKVAQQDVVAGDIRSEAEYERDPQDPGKVGKLIGYKVNRSFTVKLRDLTTLPALIDQLLAINGLELGGVEPGLEKEKEMADEAWDKALADARAHADRALKAAGMKIDSVFAISPVPFPEISGRIFGRQGPIAYRRPRNGATRPVAVSAGPGHGQPKPARHLPDLAGKIARRRNPPPWMANCARR